MTTPNVLIMMADYGHDPSETAIPFQAFKEAGLEVAFATENGKEPACDSKMLTGITQKLLGATSAACKVYTEMKTSPAIQKPLCWTAPSFSLDPYNLIFFPGGHEKSVRQLLDSPIVHQLMADYFPQTQKPSAKNVAAICHGVMVLSESMLSDGKSVLHDVTTTTLPATFEGVAYWGTRAFLGDYYKTYGTCSESTEASVVKRLDSPKQYQSSLKTGPFVVQDDKYNYISGRYPADAALLAKKTIAMVKQNFKTT